MDSSNVKIYVPLSLNSAARILDALTVTNINESILCIYMAVASVENEGILG